MRLRLDRVAIAADVEAMFHQVRVSLEVADLLRFLWKDDIRCLSIYLVLAILQPAAAML